MTKFTDLSSWHFCGLGYISMTKITDKPMAFRICISKNSASNAIFRFKICPSWKLQGWFLVIVHTWRRIFFPKSYIWILSYWHVLLRVYRWGSSHIKTNWIATVLRQIERLAQGSIVLWKNKERQKNKTPNSLQK